jgi:hypothetical protein
LLESSSTERGVVGGLLAAVGSKVGRAGASVGDNVFGMDGDSVASTGGVVGASVGEDGGSVGRGTEGALGTPVGERGE